MRTPPRSAAPAASSAPPRADADAREMWLEVNGDARRIAEGASLADLLAALGLAGRRVAVAVNRSVVPRARAAQHALAAGDRVEILEAVGGG